jgi:hypothetical protein
MVTSPAITTGAAKAAETATESNFLFILDSPEKQSI